MGRTKGRTFGTVRVSSTKGSVTTCLSKIERTSLDNLFTRMLVNHQETAHRTQDAGHRNNVAPSIARLAATKKQVERLETEVPVVCVQCCA